MPTSLRSSHRKREKRRVELIATDFQEMPGRSALLKAFQLGDERTARAVAAGDVGWVRARHAEGALRDESGLVSVAVAANQPGDAEDASRVRLRS